MRLALDDDGALVVDDIPAIVAGVVFELPKLLAPEQPDVVKTRLFPVPSQDEAIAAEWRRAQHPELFALLADARTIVTRDITSLVRNADGWSWRLVIPGAHLAAWISALNAARLTLAAKHGVTAEDMDPESEPQPDEKGRALRRIDAYGELQWMLIGATSPD
jgi:hypothetical protein